MAYRLRIDNIGANITSEDLRGLFGAFGRVRRVTVQQPVFDDGCGVRFAYVDMATADEAKACLEGIGGEMVVGHPLRLRLCPRKPVAHDPSARIGGRAAAVSSVYRRLSDTPAPCRQSC
jgi:hypothetical protein